MRCNYNLSGIKALEFPRNLYTRKPATADVFPVVANTRTKLIQKQIKSIRFDVDKVGSNKPLASKSFSSRINHLLISRYNLQASETERRCKV